MSHPNPSHDSSNEYPEDKVTHYPKAKALKKKISVKKDRHSSHNKHTMCRTCNPSMFQ